jgi:hypothetical protein
MTFVRQLCRKSRVALLALTGWLAVYGVAFAQVKAKQDEGPSLGSNTYVMAYLMVIFGVALGMLVVCRSSNRRERAKPEQFNESKAGKKEDE